MKNSIVRVTPHDTVRAPQRDPHRYSRPPLYPRTQPDSGFIGPLDMTRHPQQSQKGQARAGSSLAQGDGFTGMGCNQKAFRKPTAGVVMEVAPMQSLPGGVQTDHRMDPLRYFVSVTGMLVSAQDRDTRTYFSRTNLDRIQGMIIARAYNESQGVLDIGPQNEQVILDKMIEEYLRYPEDAAWFCEPDPNPHHTINLQVVDALMPKVYAGIRQYYNFLETETRYHGPPPARTEVGEDSRAALKDEKVRSTVDPPEYAGPIRGRVRPFTGAQPRRVDPQSLREVQKTSVAPSGANLPTTKKQALMERRYLKKQKKNQDFNDLRDRYLRYASKNVA